MKKDCRSYLLQMASESRDTKEKQMINHWVQSGSAQRCLEWDEMSDEMRFVVEDLLDAHKMKKNSCHENAWRLCVEHSRVQLHTGFVKAPFPIEHSWCSYTSSTGEVYYFDPTRLSVFAHKSSPFSEYFSLMSFKKEEALHWAYITETTGPFHRQATEVKLQKMKALCLEEETPAKKIKQSREEDVERNENVLPKVKK